MDARRVARGPLTLRVGGQYGWYRAYCPELGVCGAGVSAQEAKAALFRCAKHTAKYVVGLNGRGGDDARLPYAEAVIGNLPDIATVFREI